MKRFLILILTLFFILPLAARDLGDRARDSWRYRVVSKKSLNVRSQPGTHGSVRLTVTPGDYIYGEPVNAEWVKVHSDENLYVASQYLASEENPYYQQTELADEGYDTDRTLRIQRVVHWILLAVCILFAIVGIWWFMSEWGVELFEDSTDRYVKDHVEGYVRMKQKFYYGSTSYLAVLGIAGMLLLSMVAGVLALMIVGGAVWLIMAIIWVILWALVIVGWIGLVGGILCLFGDDETKGMGCGGIVIGGVIVGFSDAIKSFGDAAIDTGFAFFRNLYVVDFARDLVVLYWKPALLLVLAPLALFLALVLVTMLISGIFMLVEWLVMLRYNVKNPCPMCQKPSEPAIYLSNGEPLPVALHPGRYGIFYITHPATSEKLPTMLFNGKGDLPRLCHNCGQPIAAEMGSEKHIALAGVAESGKTALVYRLVAELMRTYPDNISFTDDVNSDYEMMDSIRQIVEDGAMVNLPRKTEVGRRRAIQLMIRGSQQLSYRLFINDVGGELYDLAGVTAADATDMSKFVNNVQSILFMVDPMTIDFEAAASPSEEFEDWLSKCDSVSERIDIVEAFKRLVQFFEQERRSLSKIHFNVVLAKSDLGYLNGVNLSDEEALKHFITTEMGLGNLIHQIEAKFSRIHYSAFSATASAEESRAFEMGEVLLDQLSIK